MFADGIVVGEREVTDFYDTVLYNIGGLLGHLLAKDRFLTTKKYGLT